ncbi:MAG: nucleotidyl transferase AbiEii/AbiGii toxin family protein [Proteobacteria bacterium]|nr:nucleotidyl transferase AbiEii/AbiGii toxin family protein [Pseudomonadota bacterium]
MFDRPHHNAIAKILASIDGKLLAEAECYFGGGTAIVLALGEYRESIDIDFLCASQDGYRQLRQATFGGTLHNLLKPGAEIRVLRDVRTDQYGIRTQIGAGDARVKFEIVREARIALSGTIDAALGVPVLAREDMYCEKLLANADRYADRSVLNRDIIDLSMMISRWGPVPDAAWAKARAAYGNTVESAYGKAVLAIRDPAWLRACMDGLAMDSDLADEILHHHGGARISE